MFSISSLDKKGEVIFFSPSLQWGKEWRFMLSIFHTMLFCPPHNDAGEREEKRKSGFVRCPGAVFAFSLSFTHYSLSFSLSRVWMRKRESSPEDSICDCPLTVFVGGTLKILMRHYRLHKGFFWGRQRNNCWLIHRRESSSEVLFFHPKTHP